MALRYHYLRLQVEEGHVVLNYVPTDQMLADVLTKSLVSSKHWKFCHMMGLTDTVMH